jgi:drug/metabolite transporter (DMT)-like permease
MDLSIGFGLLAAFCWGSSDFVAKIAIGKTGYLRTATFMQYVGGILLLLITFQNMTPLLRFPAETYLALGLGAVNVLGTVSLFKSFEVGQLSIVSPIASSYPALSTIFAVLLLNERVSQTRLAAILAILAGIILVSLQSREKMLASNRRVGAGVGYALCAFTSMGFLYFALKIVVADLGGFLPVLLLRWVSALVLTVAVVWDRPRSISHRPRNLILIGVVGVGDSLANIAYNLGLAMGAVAVVSTVSGLFSSVTVLLAWLLLKERLAMHQGLGFLAILVGVGIIGYFS